MTAQREFKGKSKKRSEDVSGGSHLICHNPLGKITFEDGPVESDGDEDFLSPPEATLYRTNAARANYMAQDRQMCNMQSRKLLGEWPDRGRRTGGSSSG